MTSYWIPGLMLGGDTISCLSEKEPQNRKAIIVGVNQYESDSEIPTLAGAENDAREIYERFKNNGKFEISNNHLLIGPDATRRKILKAVSEIFRREGQL